MLIVSYILFQRFELYKIVFTELLQNAKNTSFIYSNHNILCTFPLKNDNSDNGNQHSQHFFHRYRLLCYAKQSQQFD